MPQQAVIERNADYTPLCQNGPIRAKDRPQIGFKWEKHKLHLLQVLSLFFSRLGVISMRSSGRPTQIYRWHTLQCDWGDEARPALGVQIVWDVLCLPLRSTYVFTCSDIFNAGPIMILAKSTMIMLYWSPTFAFVTLWFHGISMHRWEDCQLPHPLPS